MEELTHLDNKGQSKMVDVTEKTVSCRAALARGTVEMKPETLKKILDKNITKGNVLEIAKIAGIMAAKRTSSLIPLCHPIPITFIDISFTPLEGKNMIQIEALAKTVYRTGVEMEALTAVCATALTIYDMCKYIDRGMRIRKVELISKSGGRSDLFKKEGAID